MKEMRTKVRDKKVQASASFQSSDPASMNVDDDSLPSPLKKLDDKLALIKPLLTQTGVEKKNRNDKVMTVPWSTRICTYSHPSPHIRISERNG